MEWRYLIRLEEPGKLPQPRTAILDRGPLNPLDDRHYIRPEESTFQDNDVAFFFNAFERPLRVTIIKIVEPGSYETVRMTQPFQRDQSPRMKIQTIESHRLFTQEMLTHYENTGRKESMRGTTPHMVTGWQETELESLPHMGNHTLTIPGQMGPPENSAPYTMDSGIADEAALPTMPDRVGGKRKTPLSDGETVVIRKKRRVRGKGRGQLKLQIQWGTRTIPCAFSDRLTPATVITDVGAHMEVLDTVILKMTLSSNRLAMLQRDAPLSEQGIVAGDILTLLVRHVTITDPDGIQHLVAYRADETIRDLLTTFQGVSPISPLSDIILCHNELRLDHHKRFQDCNLPGAPTLHASLNTNGNTSSAGMSLDTTDPSEGPGREPLHRDRDATLEQGNDRNDTAAEEQISGPDCSQIFLQDPKGKTHTLMFKNSESLAKNLLTHSFHLQLPPPQEIYLLSGRRVLNLDESLSGNDLPQEPLLCVML
jgi:hypothetical protein